MDANDDELDKLIQETQDIWKSLKHSGVELKDSGIDTTTNNNNDTTTNNMDTDTKLDELDKIATKLDNSTLNIVNANANNTSNTNEDRSRTLEGLNLATPTNELSSLLISQEPSKLSQIRFSTPNYKKTGHINSNITIASSLPDTPFLFSPSLPVHNVDDTNFTVSSTDKSSPVKSLPVKKKQKNNDDGIDFTDDCWHEINTMLSRFGFSVLMKQHNDNFEQISPKIIICNRFKEILNKYDKLNKEIISTNNNKQELKDLKLKNKELKNQLRISSEKINDLKHEIIEIKQENVNNDNNNNDILINIKRQLEHCKNIINKKNDEIMKLKKKLQETIEKEAIRRESVEAIFQSINKRNSRKNNKKDQKQLDIMQMYEEERKKMQNEIKFLRKEMRNLNEKFVEKNNYSDDIEQDRKKQRISFTPSSKPQSDNDNNSDSDQDDNDVIIDLKWKKQNEIKKQSVNINDLERAKDLNRLETKKLREKLEKVYAEKHELELNLEEKMSLNKSLNLELEKRPSYNEWSRLRKELNEMNKKLIETKKIASLRKYMDTRELIKRDKEIHSLNLTQIDNLPIQIMKEILQDLCRILTIKDVTILVENVNKIRKCVECVPILEQYISKIVRVLLSSDHAPQLIKISKIAPKNIFDQVVPILKEWVIKLDKIDALTIFRSKIDKILKRRTIKKENNKNKEEEKELLALHEIVKQIEELVESEEYLLNSKECFSNAEKCLVLNPNDLNNRIIRHFQHIFSIKNIQGVFPKMNQIYLELNEQKNLIKTIKSILGLPQNCAINLCFKELQKVMDTNNESSFKINKLINENKENTRNPSVITKWNEILIETKKLLQCENEDEIITQCKELIDRCKEYDAVFPRVHNLVNQLRATLNVEYAHQILPKVKELVTK